MTNSTTATTTPTDTATKPDRRWLWWLPFLLASAVFAGWASFTSQRLLGELIGWDTPWLMPAILDNLAAGTVLAYIIIQKPFTGVVSGAVLLVSALANAQAHFYDPNSADLVAPMWVAIAWSVLPPVAVFTIAHFMVEARKEPDADPDAELPPVGELDTDTDRPEPVPADSGGATNGGKPRRRKSTARRPGARGRTGPDVDTIVAFYRASGNANPSEKLIMQEHRVGSAKATTVRKQLAFSNGHPQ